MSLLMTASHIPVLVDAVTENLRVLPGGRYLDATVGGGGHAAEVLRRGGLLLGMDADPTALRVARESLGPQAILVQGNFRSLELTCSLHHFQPLDGVLFDLGLSSLQLEEAGRGFSFLRDDPLDMRYDPSQTLTAQEIVNTYPEAELARLLNKYGEERRARRIARQLLRARPLYTTGSLVAAVLRTVGEARGRLHPATRTFLALRLAVNQELESLALALPQAVRLLRPGGRLVVLSYHSLEDRIAKEFLARESRDCLCPPRTPVCICGHTASLRLITRKVLRPAPEEIVANPRSRSARLRAAERV